MNNNKFNERLKELREEKGLSQGELSQHVKVSRQSIGFYEKGERLPDIETAMNIAKYFEVTTDYLIGLSDDKNIEYRHDIDSLLKKLYERLTYLQPINRIAFLEWLCDILDYEKRNNVNYYGEGDANIIFNTFIMIISHFDELLTSFDTSMWFEKLIYEYYLYKREFSIGIPFLTFDEKQEILNSKRLSLTEKEKNALDNMLQKHCVIDWENEIMADPDFSYHSLIAGIELQKEINHMVACLSGSINNKKALLYNERNNDIIKTQGFSNWSKTQPEEATFEVNNDGNDNETE